MENEVIIRCRSCGVALKKYTPMCPHCGREVKFERHWIVTAGLWLGIIVKCLTIGLYIAIVGWGVGPFLDIFTEEIGGKVVFSCLIIGEGLAIAGLVRKLQWKRGAVLMIPHAMALGLLMLQVGAALFGDFAFVGFLLILPVILIQTKPYELLLNVKKDGVSCSQILTFIHGDDSTTKDTYKLTLKKVGRCQGCKFAKTPLYTKCDECRKSVKFKRHWVSTLGLWLLIIMKCILIGLCVGITFSHIRPDIAYMIDGTERAFACLGVSISSLIGIIGYIKLLMRRDGSQLIAFDIIASSILLILIFPIYSIGIIGQGILLITFVGIQYAPLALILYAKRDGLTFYEQLVFRKGHELDIE